MVSAMECLSRLQNMLVVVVVVIASHSAAAQQTRTFQPPLTYHGPPEKAVKPHVDPTIETIMARARQNQQRAKPASPTTPPHMVGVRPFVPLARTTKITAVHPLGAAPTTRLVNSSIRISPSIDVRQWPRPASPLLARIHASEQPPTRRMAEVGFELSLLPMGPPPRWTASRRAGSSQFAAPTESTR